MIASVIHGGGMFQTMCLSGRRSKSECGSIAELNRSLSKLSKAEVTRICRQNTREEGDA